MLLCVCVCPKGGSGSSSTAADSNGGSQGLQMSENLIYYSREEGKDTKQSSPGHDHSWNDSKKILQNRKHLSCALLAVNEFWVSVQRTEASERCGLSGSYWLKAENDVLILKEPKTKRKVLVWPYKLLRRYGRDRVGAGSNEERKFLLSNQKWRKEVWCVKFKSELPLASLQSENIIFSKCVCMCGYRIHFLLKSVAGQDLKITLTFKVPVCFVCIFLFMYVQRQH